MKLSVVSQNGIKIALFLMMVFMFVSPSFHVTGESSKFITTSSVDFSSINFPESSPIAINDLSNATEFEVFVDPIISQQLVDYHIIGATLSVVKDGKILLSKGYGYRQKFPHLVVDSNTTLFRIGSISKTFTAIAVLQLVEDGLLDLDEDVNEYLTTFQIPDTYPEPITLKHILTHTAGFEEFRISIIIPTFDDVPELAYFLSNYIPARVHAPGEISSYSNYGLGLAAYIVEEISGKSFDEYVNDEIATPLGMNYTSFTQPLPTNLESLMSDGYEESGNIGFFENVVLPGAGACSSSSGDMARLMIALLNNGTFESGRILNNETVALMQENHFKPHPSNSIPGVGLGIYELNVNDEYIIGHGGDTIYFHSKMALFPDYDFGFFISYNSRNGGYATNDFFSAIIEKYFPKDVLAPISVITENLKDFDGVYLTTRRFYNKYYYIKPHLWFDDKYTIFTNSSHLMIKYFDEPFLQLSPDFFWSRTNFTFDFFLAFVRNDKGKVTHFYSNFFPSAVSYEKIHLIHTETEIQLIFLLVVCLVYVIILSSWGIEGLSRFTKKKEKRSRSERFFKWWAFGAGVFGLIPLLYFSVKSGNVIILANEAKEALGWIIVFPYISTIQIIGVMIISGINWSKFSSSSKRRPEKDKPKTDDIKVEKSFETKGRKERPLLKNIQFTVLAIFGVFIVVFFSIWRLYGF